MRAASSSAEAAVGLEACWSSLARARRARALSAGAVSGSWVAVSSSLRASAARPVRASSRPRATCAAGKSGFAEMDWR